MPPDTGRSTFVFVEPPATVAAPARVGPVEMEVRKTREQYLPATPLEPLATPVYPARALAAKAGQATVGVRVTVNREGRVSEIGPSLLAFSTPGPFAEDFQAAVETALRQWRFHPAEIEYLELVQTPELSYHRLLKRERQPAEFDVLFTFTSGGGVRIGGTEQ